MCKITQIYDPDNQRGIHRSQDKGHYCWPLHVHFERKFLICVILLTDYLIQTCNLSFAFRLQYISAHFKS